MRRRVVLVGTSAWPGSDRLETSGWATGYSLNRRRLFGDGEPVTLESPNLPPGFEQPIGCFRRSASGRNFGSGYNPSEPRSADRGRPARLSSPTHADSPPHSWPRRHVASRLVMHRLVSAESTGKLCGLAGLLGRHRARSSRVTRPDRRWATTPSLRRKEGSITHSP